MAKGVWKMPRLPRVPRPAIVCIVILLVAVVAAVVVPLLLGREGLESPTSANQPAQSANQPPSMKKQEKMFPGVSWGSTQGGQQVTPQAPSSAMEQTLGYLQALGSAPSTGSGTGASITETTMITSAGSVMPKTTGGSGAAGTGAAGSGAAGTGAAGSGAAGAAGSPYGASDPKGAAALASSTHSHGSLTHHHKVAHHESVQSALPKGIPKSKIPHGQENLYILKTEVVPPVCPACPACPACPKPVCPKPDPSQCPPCPAPGRCPPSAFGCQRVPLYQNMNSGILPSMM